jgi:hypothetical protein
MEDQTANGSRASWTLAWLLWSSAMVLALASVVLLILNRAVLHGPEAIGPELVIVPGFATVGAVVAARRRGMGIGWWFLALALCAAVREGASQYAVRALITAPGSLVAGVWMAWLSNATWVVPFALVGFVLLLFPDGWLPSPRWRPVAWALAVCTGLLTLAGAVDPHPVDLSGVGAVSNPLGIERLRSATPILGLVFFVDMAALLASAAAPVLRFRRATCDERQQLAWVGYGHLAGNRAGPPHHPHRRGPRLRRRPAHRLSVVRRPRQGAALPIRAGLGYTSWDYQHAGAELDQDGTVALQVRLKNTGTRSGRDVVQVYASRPDSAVPRPRRWLVGFAAASAAAGEELTVPSSYPSAPSSTGTTPGMPGAPNLAHFTCTWALPPATCPAHRHRDPRQLMPGVHLPSYAPGRGRQHPTQKGHGLETRFRTLTTVPLEDPRRDEPPARRTLAVCGRAQPDGRPGQGWSGGFDGPEVFHDD